MTESLQLQGQPLRLRLTLHQKSFAMTSKAVRVRSSALLFTCKLYKNKQPVRLAYGGFVSSTSAVEPIPRLRPSRRRRAFPCLVSGASSDQGLAGRRSGPQGAERTSGACRRRVVSQCRSDASLTILEPTWKTLNRVTVEALVGQDV